MRLKYTQRISLKIIALFTIAILSTFLGDNLHGFFGDWKCIGHSYNAFRNETEACLYDGTIHEPTIHWAYRHYLYFAMCLSLFVIQVIDIIKTKP